ncbi:putative membrane-spanning protein [Dorea sp. D27]|nr:putative membrane-spanning protein [Dorea sp. D27]
MAETALFMYIDMYNEEQEGMQMMKCVTCGSELREGSLFCTYCGAKTDSLPEAGKTGLQTEEAAACKAGLEGLFSGIRAYVKSETDKQQNELAEREARIHTLEQELKEKETLIAQLREELQNRENRDAAVPVPAKHECPKCGNALSEDMVFCNQCGTKVR